MKLTNSFALSLVGVASLTAIALVKGIDVSIAISGIILAYAGSRSAEKASMTHSLSKDPNANTLEGIDKIRE